MNAPATSAERIAAALAMLPAGPLQEDTLRLHVAPLFRRVLAGTGACAYLANHSLGRPLDVTEDDVREGLAAWYAQMGGAWTAWSEEMGAYRARLARLLNASRADCVVPKGSAGQGLRSILNTFDGVPRVVATRGEFDSLDVILREYARRGRIDLTLVDARADGCFASADILAALGTRADLVVVSQVIFNSGQVLPELPAVIAAAHRARALVLLDVYHSLGVFPVDLNALDVDFAVGGSYKYLRGGTGACFLYLHPRHLTGRLRTLDTGWFAKRDAFTYQRPDPPQFGEGGDAFLESTPAILPFYQARAGQLFTLGIGVDRLREYSLGQQQRLIALLSKRQINALGGTEDRGAFVVVVGEPAVQWAAGLAERGVVVDARGRYLRLCPDILTTTAELDRAVDALASLM